MISSGEAVLGVLILTRVSAFIAVFPLFGRRQLPKVVKLGMAGALTVFWLAESQVNTFAAQDLASIGNALGLMLVLREAFVGALIAFSMGLFFWPAKVAGGYIGQEMGLSMAAINDPSSQDSSTLVAAILDSFGILLFFLSDFHHFVLLVLHESLHQFHSFRLDLIPTSEFVASLSEIPAQGLLMIAPLVVLLGALTVFISYLNRAAPALNLFTVGLPVRLLIGLFGLYWMSPTILAASQAYMFRVSEKMEELLGFLV